MNLRLSGQPLREVLASLCEQRPQWREPIMDLANAKRGVEITLQPVKRHRSLEQNARYWALVTKLAEAVGYTKAEMHEEVLCEYHGYELIEFRGSVRKRPKGRSKELNTMDFVDLSTIVERWCAEQGVWVESA